ncbi:site-specific integrase [Pedobacter miscanthi]|jgi:site-specific recombinase XerD|uniref:site-specific integrase n=1 Tax=Pedobacter miscanthi TaxID=2259170 RepID=UPI00292D2AFF|nr:tyrosine-type recombinase/integrase [Pedobacter miscanthi]
MKSNQKLLLMFWLFRAKATKKDGKAPLYVRITIDGKDEEISLSRKVHPDFWDTEKKKSTENSSDAKLTNKKILEVQVDLDRHFTVLQSQYEVITPLMLKNAYNGLPVLMKKYEVKQPIVPIPTLLTAFDNFIVRFRKMVDKGIRSDETLRHWKSRRTKIQAFIAFQYGIQDMELADIRYSFAEKLYDYFTFEIDKPLAEITAKGHIKKTIQILKGCVTNDFLQKNPIESFVCSGGEKDVEPLELEQVQRIIQKDFAIQRLTEVKDAFIFQCFTGFAYQDIYALSKENIVIVGNKGERWLIKDRGKTEVSERVPILPIVEELIQKYAAHPYCVKYNRLMPINSNTKYNGYLKEIGDICGILLELNTHRARHTFAHIMLNSGVPLEDVSKMLGHKSIRTTQRYCRVSMKRISENVGKVRKILFTQGGVLKKVS